jgi:choline-sulfatase
MANHQIRRTGIAPFVQTASRTRRPNLLFLMADDHAGYALGADGSKLARTPNLDGLAGESVRFAHNYCNSPVCTPSRQSILTGQLPHTAGVTVLRTPLSPDKPTVAKQLLAAGYSTGVIGKMHWNQTPEPGLHGFEWAKADQAAYEWHREETKIPKPVPGGIATKPQWRPFRDPARIWLNADKLPDPGYEQDLRGTFIALRASEYIREHKNHPFALWASFNEPHSPFAFPVEDQGRFDLSAFPIPPVGRDDEPLVPLIFRELSTGDKRGINAAYHTSVEYLDRNLGRVLRALHEAGLDEDTLVVYTADHGYCLGHHGRFEKHSLYEEPTRTPLMMRFPGRFEGGRTIDAMTESVDISRTLLELLEAEPLPVNHGRSLAPLLAGTAATHRDVIFFEYLENEEAAVKTEDWKLIYCSGNRHRQDGYETHDPTPGRYLRLYNLKDDPAELNNLAGKPEHGQLTETLKRYLLTRFLTTHPEAAQLPIDRTIDAKLDWFLRPRDAASSA